jgi:hypothetical protein
MSNLTELFFSAKALEVDSVFSQVHDGYSFLIGISDRKKTGRKIVSNVVYPSIHIHVPAPVLLLPFLSPLAHLFTEQFLYDCI